MKGQGRSERAYGHSHGSIMEMMVRIEGQMAQAPRSVCAYLEYSSFPPGHGIIEVHSSQNDFLIFDSRRAPGPPSCHCKDTASLPVLTVLLTRLPDINSGEFAGRCIVHTNVQGQESEKLFYLFCSF